MRLTVLVSGSGSNLKAIASAIETGYLKASINAVISDRPGIGAEDFCRAQGLDFRVVDRAVHSAQMFQRDLAETTQRSEPDLVVLAGFMRIVSAEFLDACGGQVINIHPSLLPAFPGRHGPADAVAKGVALSGCTVHRVDAGVDTGQILAQVALGVRSRDASALHAAIQKAEHRVLPWVIRELGEGRTQQVVSSGFARGIASVETALASFGGAVECWDLDAPIWS